MGTNFLGSPSSLDFTAFSLATGNWWGNPCISHIIKYTIECESNGKKAPILWEKYEYQFPRFSTYNGFWRIFSGTNFPDFPHSMGLAVFSHVMRNYWENKCISHVMKYTIKWESNGKKASIIWEKYELQFPRFSPYDEVCCFFLYNGKLMGKPMHFPNDEVYRRMGIVLEKITHTMGKAWVTISQVPPIRRILLHFHILWEIDGETDAFPICWSIP